MGTLDANGPTVTDGHAAAQHFFIRGHSASGNASCNCAGRFSKRKGVPKSIWWIMDLTIKSLSKHIFKGNLAQTGAGGLWKAKASKHELRAFPCINSSCPRNGAFCTSGLFAALTVVDLRHVLCDIGRKDPSQSVMKGFS